MNDPNDIRRRLNEVRGSLPPNVRLVAISKYHDIPALQAAYDAGQRLFGESREQELIRKQKALPNDIEWHFIGHLQTNKVRAITPFIACVQSVDSLRLLTEIDKRAKVVNRVIDVLLEAHVTSEETKSGFAIDELMGMLRDGAWRSLTSVRLRGLMGMATNTDDDEVVRADFQRLGGLFERVKREFFNDDSQFDTLSMGMTHDYKLALAEGTNMVRIGTGIFGEREY